MRKYKDESIEYGNGFISPSNNKDQLKHRLKLVKLFSYKAGCLFTSNGRFDCTVYLYNTIMYLRL